MDDTNSISPRERGVVAALALVVVVLAMLRPTPDLRDQGDGVNAVPIGAHALRDAGPADR